MALEEERLLEGMGLAVFLFLVKELRKVLKFQGADIKAATAVQLFILRMK